MKQREPSARAVLLRYNTHELKSNRYSEEVLKERDVLRLPSSGAVFSAVDALRPF